MIEIDNNILSIREQCMLLGVNRSTLYYDNQSISQGSDTELANEIHTTWMEMPFYGYRRITADLKRKGYCVNGKKILRLMGEMNIEAIYPRPRGSFRAPGHKIYPYLLNDLKIEYPDQVWSTDITYLKMPHGFSYLVGLIDIYSRYIVSWRLSNTVDTSFCIEMLDEALKNRVPKILNTDQGSQFTSDVWVSRVKSAGSQVSMDGKGRWADNVFIERFWRTLKHEHILLNSYSNLIDLRESINGFIDLYNHRRLHQSLGYRTPAEVYSKRPIQAIVPGGSKVGTEELCWF